MPLRDREEGEMGITSVCFSHLEIALTKDGHVTSPRTDTPMRRREGRGMRKEGIRMGEKWEIRRKE